MNTSVPSVASSQSQDSSDELLSTSKHQIKFALCVSPLLAVIGLAVYCFFVGIS